VLSGGEVILIKLTDLCNFVIANLRAGVRNVSRDAGFTWPTLAEFWRKRDTPGCCPFSRRILGASIFSANC
jgi:hypothetical protein